MAAMFYLRVFSLTYSSFLIKLLNMCDYVEGHLCGEFCDVMMYAMSVYKQVFIVHCRTVDGAQLQEMMKTSTHHWVNTLRVTYLKCISLFIGRGVSLATLKMYNFIIIWENNLG